LQLGILQLSGQIIQPAKITVINLYGLRNHVPSPTSVHVLAAFVSLILVFAKHLHGSRLSHNALGSNADPLE
jgi:hypothetical protein